MPMKPPPPVTKLVIAAFWLSSNASSPVVSANIRTSIEPSRAAVTSARSSVAATVNAPVPDASDATAARAAGMDSWRNAAVAVIISTRTGAAAGDGEVVDVAAAGGIGADA